MLDINKQYGPSVEAQYYAALAHLRSDIYSIGLNFAKVARGIGLDPGNLNKYLHGVILMPLSVFIAIRGFIINNTPVGDLNEIL